jgi:hypothetical protein
MVRCTEEKSLAVQYIHKEVRDTADKSIWIQQPRGQRYSRQKVRDKYIARRFGFQHPRGQGYSSQKSQGNSSQKVKDTAARRPRIQQP